MISAIVGINWGDEGKGRIVDLFSGQYDIVVRYQGGNNAGHTVINDRGAFVLNLLPSGVLRENTVNIMGNGMVIDLEHLCGEMAALAEKGVTLSPCNLKISDKAIVCMPYHKQLDILEEERLADRRFGSTRRGIAPAYADKYMKKCLRMGDLLAPELLKEKVEALVQWKNLTVHGGYGHEKIDSGKLLKWLLKFSEPLKEYISDVTTLLLDAENCGKKILFEAQLGALRDIDFGIYPYTTSSSTIAAYAPIGAGIPACKVNQIIGVMKAYSSCVGEGPFTSEFFGTEAEKLREAGAEYGAATGRPRRVGAFDVVASKYGVMMQGANHLALTKMDVLSYMSQIPVCVAYDVDGVITQSFPTGDRLNRAKPVYEYLPGFQEDLSKCRKKSDLPSAALSYIRFIESQVGCPIRYVSVGPQRDAYLTMEA